MYNDWTLRPPSLYPSRSIIKALIADKVDRRKQMCIDAKCIQEVTANLVLQTFKS